jgi:hypothetical protein
MRRKDQEVPWRMYLWCLDFKDRLYVPQNALLAFDLMTLLGMKIEALQNYFIKKLTDLKINLFEIISMEIYLRAL